jgi:hypothetical protein
MVGFPCGLVPCVVHSLFKEYHTCARSFSLLLPPLAFSLSRPARTRLKKLLKPLLTPPLRMPPTWRATLPLLLRMLLATPWAPLRVLLTPLATLLPLLPVLLLAPLLTLLPLLRKLPTKHYRIGNSRKGAGTAVHAPFFVRGRGVIPRLGGARIGDGPKRALPVPHCAAKLRLARKRLSGPSRRGRCRAGRSSRHRSPG